MILISTMRKVKVLEKALMKTQLTVQDYHPLLAYVNILFWVLQNITTGLILLRPLVPRLWHLGMEQ